MRVRYHIEISGVVQGVGYRPFVYNLAHSLGLSGHVYNHAQGVSVEAEGEEAICQDFITALRVQAPALAVVQQVRSWAVAPRQEEGFRILPSRAGQGRTLVAPDLSICEDCLAELRNPADRRYRYSFLNCTHCGPRFTIIRDLPDDRSNTSMAVFPLCPDCAAEYRNPTNRRFHAQPTACPVCGPQLRWLDENGCSIVGDALEFARMALYNGSIVAVKGLGGYHLVCDAQNAEAVQRLRQRKYRFDKPFALMMPDVDTVRCYCVLNEQEETLLCSTQRPIVLLKKQPGLALLPEQLAPGNRRLGVMLPYTPLHYLLIEGFRALVMTSGNVSDEPIVYEDAELVQRLSGIADGFLTHNRAIVRRCDDSVLLWAAGGSRMLRRSRGYAPQALPFLDCGHNILACGGEQKNVFCLVRGSQAFLSAHIGDLDNPATLNCYDEQIADFCRMFDSQPDVLVHDLHPDYFSTQYAKEQARQSAPQTLVLGVQHHHAHLASVLAERQYAGRVLGLIFDGTGYGLDGSLWGGEFLLGDCAHFQRLAHLAALPLPGGEAAIREPWRIALAALLDLCGGDTVALQQLAPPYLLQKGWPIVMQAVSSPLYASRSTAMGRLFDAIAAIAGIGLRSSYEGQAAVALEQKLDEATTGAYQFTIEADRQENCLIADWRPVVRQAVADVHAGVGPGLISARFHRAVVDLCLRMSCRLAAHSGVRTLALSGGCWQNVYLLEQVIPLLQAQGFTVLTNTAVPCNDGGLAFGQAAVAAALLKRGEISCV